MLFAMLAFLGLGSNITACKSDSSSTAAVTAVRDLARLESVQYRIVDIVDRTIPTTLLGHTVAEDHIFLVVPADITAGVDLSTAQVDANVEQHRVRVRLPAPTVLATSIDAAHIRAIRQTGLLSPTHEDLESAALREAQSKLTQDAIDQGILTRAKSNAERTLRSLLGSLGFTTVEVTWNS